MTKKEAIKLADEFMNTDGNAGFYMHGKIQIHTTKDRLVEFLIKLNKKL